MQGVTEPPSDDTTDETTKEVPVERLLVVSHAPWDTARDLDLKRLLLLVERRGGRGLYLRMDKHRPVAERPRPLDAVAPAGPWDAREPWGGLLPHPSLLATAAREWLGGPTAVLLGAHIRTPTLQHFAPAHFASCLYDGCLLPPGVFWQLSMADAARMTAPPLSKHVPADEVPTAALLIDDRVVAQEWALNVAARAPRLVWRAVGPGAGPATRLANLVPWDPTAAELLAALPGWRGLGVCPDRPLGNHGLVRAWLPELARAGVTLVGAARALPEWVRAVQARRASDFTIAMGAQALQPDRRPYAPPQDADVAQVLRQLAARAASPHPATPLPAAPWDRA